AGCDPQDGVAHQAGSVAGASTRTLVGNVYIDEITLCAGFYGTTVERSAGDGRVFDLSGHHCQRGSKGTNGRQSRRSAKPVAEIRREAFWPAGRSNTGGYRFHRVCGTVGTAGRACPGSRKLAGTSGIILT